jgi:TldD protein
MLEKNLKQYAKYFKGYTELRVQENQLIALTTVNGNLISNTDYCSKGVSARIYKNGSWGFASAPGHSEETIVQILQYASSNAELLDDMQQLKYDTLSHPAVSSNNHFKHINPRRSRGELLDFLMGIDSYMDKKCRKLSSRRMRFKENAIERNLLTSEGTSAYSLIPNSAIYLDLATEKDGETTTLMSIIGNCGWADDVFSSPKNILRLIDERYEMLLRKSEGIFPEAGLKECILSQELSAMLAHEAIGHVVEADCIAGGSIVAGMMDTPIASPLVTMVDFANTYNGMTCPMPVYVDDEGILAKDAHIIERGILKSFLHTQESAVHFGVRPHGNARAAEFCDEPIVRMRNTAFLPGKDKLEAMIASVEDGYYLAVTGRGMADGNAEFVFGVGAGYEIKNGKLGRPIKDTSMSGSGLDVLKSISMVSDEIKWFGGWLCGKRQSISIGAGGPALKCRLHIGGR